jgi:hypothetical protein
MCTILWNSSKTFLYLCNDVKILFDNVNTSKNTTNNTFSNTSQIINYTNISSLSSPSSSLSSPSSSLSSPSSSLSSPSSSLSSTFTETTSVVSNVNFAINSTNNTTPNLRGHVPGPNLHLLHLLWLLLPFIFALSIFIYKRKQKRATICPSPSEKYTPKTLSSVVKIAKPKHLNISQESSSTEETIIHSPHPPLPPSQPPKNQKNLPTLPPETDNVNIDNPNERRQPNKVMKRGNSMIVYRGKKTSDTPPQRSKSLPTKRDN